MSRPRATLTAAVMLVLAACSSDPENERAEPAGRTDSGSECAPTLADAFDAWGEAGFSGSIAIFTDGEPGCLAAYGVADRSDEIPNTVDTVFSIESVTKAFTAAAVLDLADQGTLSLDDRPAISCPASEVRPPTQPSDSCCCTPAASLDRTVDEAQVLAAAKGLDLSLTARSSAEASIEEAAVRRAVANLVDNAIKYAPFGSAVEVTVETRGSEAAVIVTDHGPGIPPDQQAHIFDRFWRGPTDTEGTGLGVPIAHQIALAHGGTLAVTSPGPGGGGGGTQFRLRLRR